jgi:hypothetical protein
VAMNSLDCNRMMEIPSSTSSKILESSLGRLDSPHEAVMSCSGKTTEHMELVLCYCLLLASLALQLTSRLPILHLIMAMLKTCITPLGLGQ